MFKNASARLDLDTDFSATAIGRALHAAPIGVIDIGARDGVHEMFYPLGKLAHILAFEPDPEACAELQCDAGLNRHFASVTLRAEAVGDGTDVPFHIQAKPTNNSLLLPNPDLVERYHMDLFRNLAHERIATRRLDDIVFEPGAGRERAGEIIKIDVQGSEQLIFQHASRVLSENTVALVSEVWFCEIYKGQALFHDVCGLLARLGLSFYGFTSMFLRSGKRLDKRYCLGRERALYADAVFIRDPFDHPRMNASERHIAVLLAFALVSGYFDLALEAAEICDKADRDRLARLVHRMAEPDIDGLLQFAEAAVKSAHDDRGRANIVLGKLADRWRGVFDFGDQA
jgi:FkbM family methyltransferase